MYMENTGSIFADSPYKGSGSLTREQFYFYEMRTTARLLCQGLGEKEVRNKIKSENLFQFPTERTVNQAVSACLKRLSALKTMLWSGQLRSRIHIQPNRYASMP
jgi:hypothetical protein